MKKDDFLQLLVTQMQKQVGFNKGQTPWDLTPFLTQSLQSNLALQASALVGRKVLVPSQHAIFNGQEFMNGVVDLTQSVHDLHVQIYNNQDELVHTQAFGMSPKGEVHFVWDGKNELRRLQPPGRYRLSAMATIHHELQSMKTLVAANVDSVSLNQSSSEMTLHVAGLGAVAYGNIRELAN